jgi:two-component system response regulator (stage 0 sporulation protein A)
MSNHEVKIFAGTTKDVEAEINKALTQGRHINTIELHEGGNGIIAAVVFEKAVSPEPTINPIVGHTQSGDGITNLLFNLGIPAHVRGFRYIREAVKILESNKGGNLEMTAHLYPTVAEKFNTTPQRVERTIRHAIEMASEKKMGAFVPEWAYRKPVNSEFLATIVEKLALEGASC